MSALRRRLLGMISILDTEVNAVLSTTFTTASDVFIRASKQLELEFLAPMQCYYGLGLYGHVVVIVQEDTLNCLLIQVKAQCEKRMNWFIRSLQSALSDDGVFSLSSKAIKKVGYSSAQKLTSALALLSNVETQPLSVDDEPLEVLAGSPIDSPLENFRREFLKKQSKIIDSNKGRRRSLDISYKEYETWQANCFL